MEDKIAIITGVFGGYDTLLKPKYWEKLKNECDFICFTDDARIKSDFAKVIKVTAKSRDPQRNARYYKIIGYEKYLRNYKYILWLDANYYIIASSLKSMVASKKEFDVTAILHSDRDCLYDEAEWVVSAKRDSRSIVEKQVKQIREAGFPQHFGLAATGFLLRKATEPTNKFNKIWWQMVKKGSKRDQLAFDYCRWVLRDSVGFSFFKFSWRENDFVILRSHGIPRASLNKKPFWSGFKKIIPPKIKYILKRRLDRSFRLQELERERIDSIPRFTETELNFLDKRIRITDIASFRFMESEIFNKRVYNFRSSSDKPYIIDCGANIGLSVIYFKRLFPGAEIVAFEPDGKIFDVLDYNVKKAFGYIDVKLIKKACWNDRTTLKFYSEGADGGRLVEKSDLSNIIEIETVRLKDYLNRKVDFLKIDIEGAENTVIKDCADLLNNVENIFVEYHSFVRKEQFIPEILQVLKNAGFRLHITAPGLTSPNPFMKLKQYAGMDNQLNIYGFRIG